MATIAPEAARNRRWAELGLLVVALGLGAYAYLQVGLNTSGHVPPNLVRDTALFAGLALGLHLVLRWRAPYADPILLPVAVALGGIGMAMIARIDVAEQIRGNAGNAAPRQLMWMVLGMVLAAGVLLFLRDHRTLRRFTYTAMVASIGLLLLPMVPGLGVERNGATVWIELGPFSFQPAEFAKVTLAAFFAGYLVTNRDTLTLAGPRFLGLQLPRLRDLGPLVLTWAMSVGILVVQRDLGTSLLLFGMFVAMLYVATERLSWVLIGVLLAVGGAAAAATTFSHVGARFDVWLRPFDPEIYNRLQGGSGQLVGGLFGMASGGLLGTGWGLGHPHLVAYANSDFITASLGEELGLTGLLAILLAYLLIAQRGLRTAIGVRDGFGKLLASGLAFTIAIQCFVVVGGITRLIPLTGLTMPFLAAGGSSLVSNWIILALLLRMSDAARRPAPEPGPIPEDAPEAADDDAHRDEDAQVTEVVRRE